MEISVSVLLVHADVVSTVHSHLARLVLVNLTDAGTVALEDYRAQASAALGMYLAKISDEQVDALAAATEALSQLVTLLQEGPSS